MKNSIGSILARRIINDSGCWEWTGRRHDGYGYVSWCGRNHRVHRLVYQQIVGTVPEGFDLDHLCRNRACFNPDHLEPVTRSENLRRSPMLKLNNGNANKTQCGAGHEYSPENTYWRPNGGRTCRACNRVSAARTQRVRLDRMITGRWDDGPHR